MLSVHNEWDPLKVCIVGKSYPPEFYSFIQNKNLRKYFEIIASETNEDFEYLSKTLAKLGVEVLRPNVPDHVPEKFLKADVPVPPPLCSIPRDMLTMIGDKFFVFPENRALRKTIEFVVEDIFKAYDDCWTDIVAYVKSKGNQVIDEQHKDELKKLSVNGIYRIGKDIFFGTRDKVTDYRVLDAMNLVADTWLRDYTTWPVTTGGHIDGCFMPLKPGLLFSAHDMGSYDETFPGWEVVYFENNYLNKMGDWTKLKNKNNGKWYLKNAAYDDELIDYVEKWLTDWTGTVEETVFDVNILMVNEKTAIVSNEDDRAFDAFKRHGITPHLCPMRHRYFWDSGIHCATAELHREGVLEDVFASMKNNG